MTKKGMSVEELYKVLAILIHQGDGDKTVTLSVCYDNCDHLQDLQSVHNYEGIDWIILNGEKELEE